MTVAPVPPASPPASPVDPHLLSILVCPLTKTALRYDRATNELVSEKAGLAFPIRDGIPIMLVDEARRIEDDPYPPIPAELRR
jgi:uncharacterized protein YbaR (Trm112 family)